MAVSRIAEIGPHSLNPKLQIEETHMREELNRLTKIWSMRLMVIATARAR